MENFALAILGTLVFVFWGVGLLRGANLARTAYIILSPTFITLNLLLGGLSTQWVVSVLVYLLFAYLLNTAEAEAYFGKSGGNS